jgi:hypothetical protein
MGHRHLKQRAPRLKRKRIAHVPGFTNEFAVAEELGVSVRTLRGMRQRGEGPPYVKFARQIHYPDEPRRTWLQRHVVQPVRSELVA